MFQLNRLPQFPFGRSLALVAAIALLQACTYNSEEDLYPGGDVCDTSDVSYNQDVLPILVNNCYVCHDNTNRQGGIILEGYDQLKTHVNSGRLIGAIRRESGFSPMPQGSPALPDCQIETIAQWITDGAPEN
ncbi:MAG: hypothetical protein KTR30_09710 [Saprospiraceae bacterium]|nr:hypothetical protein [Saprospiraceae bacterium]